MINMDEFLKKGIADFINLVFGAGMETTEFWQNILITYVSQYYIFGYEELVAYNVNLNALFMAFTYHSGI